MGDTAEDQAMVEAPEATSFSELLMLSDGFDDHHREINGGDGGEDSFSFVFSGTNGSKMLCFSGDCQNGGGSPFLEPSLPSGVSVSLHALLTLARPQTTLVPSLFLCANYFVVKKKRTGSSNGQDMDHNRKPSKKCKRNQEKSSVRIAKVRKERLGERIAALQHLVSPYGKTDAASVLHEAMGYIKFLQDQIQVLCSPYLINYSLDGGVVTGDITLGKKVRDLRSRGLCLVPVSSTEHVENSNGADLWSPATASMGHTMSPSQ
ncbi:unnamed protein product [Eruca vesicaria subsp. sativa]|uniref:BHLH domain-containing protein n=1 Tax=Eruca vesicaria subsp. sativa TaxID=29727 RepID=A0ABC8JAX4_ERUVS|nr:unnamed protein product [Eruca vesicaria subsp. sativa]